MKRVISTLLCILTILLLFPLTAHADIGPKPSVVINFNGLDGETCYATLLSSAKSTGPYSALNDSNQSYAHYQEGDDGYDIFLKFAEYEDTDGFHFLQFLEDCSQTQQLSWTYYPPAEFKILLYFPETDRFLVSDQIYERYAFDSYYTAQVSGSDLSAAVENQTGIIAVKSYDYTNEIVSLSVRIVLTILIELAIALLFGFREKKQFRFIVFVNLVTQIALNVALNMINYYSGQMAFVIFYILLEFAVFLIEAILYSWYLKKYSQKKISGRKPCIYALAANTASFALGWGLAYWIPGIF